jgi:hypothetical protein
VSTPWRRVEHETIGGDERLTITDQRFALSGTMAAGNTLLEISSQSFVLHRTPDWHQL